MKIRYAPLAVACAWAMTVAATAQAAPITYTFGGTLDSVDAALSPLAAGDTFTGTLSIESTAPNVGDPGFPDTGVYSAGYSMNVTVHGYTYFSSDGEVSVHHGGIYSDSFAAVNKFGVYGVGTPPTGPSLGLFQPSGFALLFSSNSSNLFSSTALPSNLALSSFDEPSVFLMAFRDANSQDFAGGQGTLTSFTQVTAAPVPEASTSAMLALGLGALAFVRRRQAS